MIFTEGIRKRDAAVSQGLFAIALTGVNNWRGRNDAGGLVALPDFHDVALKGRRVYLAWDSDAWEKPEVHASLADFRAWLSRGADVRIIYLPSGDDGRKVGLDDFFAAGHTPTTCRRSPAPNFVRHRTANASRRRRSRPCRRRRPPTCWTPCASSSGRYIVMGGTQHDAVALWVAHTHAFDVAGSTPYLAVNSAEPESGKTQLLEVLEAIVARPWFNLGRDRRRVDPQGGPGPAVAVVGLI